MILSSISLLPHLFALFGAEAPATVAVSRVVIRDEIILRVPVIRPRVDSPVLWVERKGPRCIRSDEVRAASLTNEGSIDFLMRNRRRIRAKMGSQCPTLDFYGGFYLQPEDDRICAGREEIRNRIGGSCQIERFRMMVPTAAK